MARELTAAAAQRLIAWVCLAASLVASGCGGGASFMEAQRETEAWRAKHEADYRRDWSTIAGLHFLNPGAQSAGSAPTNQIVLPSSVPATLGRFVLDGESVRFEPEPGTNAQLRGQAITAPVVLKDDGSDEVDEVVLGDVKMVIHRSGPRKTLRVWDPDGPLAQQFQGFRWFDIQPEYRVVGRFIPDAKPGRARVVNTFGDFDDYVTEGVVEFTLNGRTLRLRPFTTRAKRFYFVFKDESSGNETYEAARFLYSDLRDDGTTVLDFNQAYQPAVLVQPVYYLPDSDAGESPASESSGWREGISGARAPAGSLTASAKRLADLLESVVMPYAWGSRTAIADLQGRPSPSPGPEAELWMGAHPRGPSRLIRRGVATTLADVIAADAAGALGDNVAASYGHRLPFLLKVLAAGEPLSLQAHPTADQAKAGFEREERLGIPVDAPHRNYKDPSHKPELICALTPFDALCGFRSIPDTLALFDALGVTELDATIAPLQWSDRVAGLSATLHAIMTKPEPARTEMVDAVVASCAEHEGPFSAECRWAVRLDRLYPGDPGVVTSLLLNLVHLEPGEAIYLGAGNLHAYLGGAGVEIMASSDNVLRGGLTPKHVDLDELLSVLEFVDGPIDTLRPRAVDGDEDVWDTPAPEFRLSRLTLRGRRVPRAVAGPEILLCTEGAVMISDSDGRLALSHGASAFIPGSTREYTLSGDGQVYRATVGA